MGPNRVCDPGSLEKERKLFRTESITLCELKLHVISKVREDRSVFGMKCMGTVKSSVHVFYKFIFMANRRFWKIYSNSPRHICQHYYCL